MIAPATEKERWYLGNSDYDPDTLGGVEVLAMLRRKPARDDECNRCGLCCAMSLCVVGMMLFRGDMSGHNGIGRCPGLKLDSDGRHSCDVWASPGAYITDAAPGLRAAVKSWLERSMGKGCDSADLSEWEE